MQVVPPGAQYRRPFLLREVCRRGARGKGESGAVLVLRAAVHPHRAAVLSVRGMLP